MTASHPARGGKTAVQVVLTVGLALLTAAELGLRRLGLPHALTLGLLLALALANAALVVAVGMGLWGAARPLKLAFVLPLVLPAAFAVAIVAEAVVGAHGP
jgi:cytochrome c oxidase subunit IV